MNPYKEFSDRMTLAQLLSSLLPSTARQTIHLSIVSLKNNQKLKKEILKVIYTP